MWFFAKRSQDNSRENICSKLAGNKTFQMTVHFVTTNTTKSLCLNYETFRFVHPNKEFLP